MADKIGLRIDRLKTARQQLGWSQRELARRCGFSDAAIRKYEAGISDPTGYSLKMLVEQLHVSADYLLGITEEPDSAEEKRQADEKNGLNRYFGTVTDEPDIKEKILFVYSKEGWSGLKQLSEEHLSNQSTS